MVIFEDGRLVKGAYVIINGVEYEVHMPQYEGKTPLSAENLNKLQENVENAIPVIVDNLTTADETKALSANQGKALNEKIDNNNSYSTEEQVIGKWIDGKKIYRKVVNFTLSNTLNQWNEIAQVTFDIMISLKGFMNAGSDEWYPLQIAGNDEDIWFYASRYRKCICEKHNYEYANNQPCFLIVEYTKTTD